MNGKTLKNLCYTVACVLMTATVVLPGVASAATYYVATSPTGNDGNAGTQAAPFGTIEFALNKLMVGDTLFIRGGTYAERLENEKGINWPSGISWTNPVTIAAFPGEIVILEGYIGITRNNLNPTSTQFGSQLASSKSNPTTTRPMTRVI